MPNNGMKYFPVSSDVGPVDTPVILVHDEFICCCTIFWLSKSSLFVHKY